MSELTELVETWERRPEPPELDASLEALRANAQLVALLTRARYGPMLDALEAGADWDDLADALDGVRGKIWSEFCKLTDALDPDSTDAIRAATVKDPLRGKRPRIGF